MAKTCISNCINDTRVPLPVRPTYVNLYKWPESDAEFVRSLSSDWRSNGGRAHPTVVDSISCRQIYLRSYTFHRNNQTETENTNVLADPQLIRRKGPERSVLEEKTSPKLWPKRSVRLSEGPKRSLVPPFWPCFGGCWPAHPRLMWLIIMEIEHFFFLF
ncbi:hypothetical protein ERO13_A07G094900v2 [Gossypium hirsutum]|nr:hypothetical protein ERO13_A07G094900v2 [Gossypium hirsutum]